MNEQTLVIVELLSRLKTRLEAHCHFNDVWKDFNIWGLRIDALTDLQTDLKSYYLQPRLTIALN